jgi:hypothetical protein
MQRTKFLMDRVPGWISEKKIGSIKFQNINLTLLFMAIPVEILLVQSKVSSRKFLMLFKDGLGIQLQNCMSKVAPKVSLKETRTIMTSLTGHAGAESSYAIFLARLTIADEFFVKHLKAADRKKTPLAGLSEFSVKLSTMVKMLVRVYDEFLVSWQIKLDLKGEINEKVRKQMIEKDPKQDEKRRKKNPT